MSQGSFIAVAAWLGASRRLLIRLCGRPWTPAFAGATKLVVVAVAALIAAGGAPILPEPAFAQANGDTDANAPPPPPAGSPEVKLRLRGKPGGSVGGASRGAVKTAQPLPTIELLAPPDQTGETADAAPVLYFAVSGPVAWPMQFTISAPLQSVPLVEVTIPSAPAAGIYPVRLSDYRAQLAPGIIYTWSISAILDPHAWSRNIVASATILRSDEPGAAAARAAPAAGQAAIFAQAGLWYDAVAAAVASEAVDRHAALDALLDQAGLGALAKTDRARLTARGSPPKS
jgi:hypothetical protein